MDHMSSIEIYDDLEQALADCHYVFATTARRRDMVQEVFTAQSACKKAHELCGQGQKTAILFGPERTGLLNEDLSYAQATITIPLNPEFSSLNLAQAVLIVAYEYAQIRDKKHITPEYQITGDSLPASQNEIYDFLIRLNKEMESGHFFRNPDVRPHMERNVKNLFTRAGPTNQEIKTLHGIVSALIGKKKART